MEAKMIWGNLCSGNIKITIEFYTKLGFQYNGTHNSDEMASFLFGENKFVINFFTKERLNDERNGSLGNWENQSEIIFSLSANDKEEVNQWREKVLEAGGTIFSEPQDYEKGYTFGFADPDGHKFNVLYWPGM